MASDTKLLTYIPRSTPVHRLCGATKLIVFLAWTIVCMLSYNTWVLLGALLVGIIVFRLARIQVREVRFVLITIIVFLTLTCCS